MSSGSITISAADGVTQISLQANPSSSCTIAGGFQYQSLPSNPVTISDGQSITITSPTYSPLDNVVIAWVSGTVDIVMGF